MNGENDAYVAVLADLERRRDELDRTIASIRLIIGQAANPPESGGAPGGGGGGGGGRGEPRELRSDMFFNMKAPEAVRTYMGFIKRPQTIRQIVDALKAGGFISGAKDLYNNLYTAILRMEENGIVVKVHGKWGLAEWYPARPKPKGKGQPAEKEVEKDPDEDVDLSELKPAEDTSVA
jgi:hypothetical protein